MCHSPASRPRWSLVHRQTSANVTAIINNNEPIAHFLVSSSFIQGRLGDNNQECAWRLAERWKFDEDDSAAVGSQGPDEQGRIPMDDYHPKFLRHSITLLHEQDQHTLLTDNSLNITAPDGHLQSIVPYRLGMQTSHDATRCPTWQAADGNSPHSYLWD